MARRDLNEFLRQLEACDELVRVSEPVSPDLEITEITDRVTKAGGPALLFEQVEGSRIPLCINLFGSERRMCMALGVDSLDDFGALFADYLEPRLPETLVGKVRKVAQLGRLRAIFPKLVENAPCQEIVETLNPSLAEFPIIKCWPDDGGRFITFPLVVTKHPETGVRNIGLYRMQVYDERTTGMHWHRHKGGAEHYAVAEARGDPLEVAVALGPDPLLMYAASAPLPDPLDEYWFAGFLAGERVEVTKCLTVDLEVPAESQIVIEGYVPPGERRIEGPFGDHNGYYSVPAEYPVFHVTAITHRRDPIYPTTIVGPPIQEDAFLGTASVRIFLPLIQRQLPEIVDMHLPPHGVFHNLAIVSIRKRYPGHAKKIMHALWGMGQLMLEKVIVVVDEDVDVHDPGEVLWRAGSSIDPKRDALITEGPLDALDHAAMYSHLGGKLGIDGTTKLPGEGIVREWPPITRMSDEIKAAVDARWERLGIRLPSEGERGGHRR